MAEEEELENVAAALEEAIQDTDTDGQDQMVESDTILVAQTEGPSEEVYETPPLIQNGMPNQCNY